MLAVLSGGTGTPKLLQGLTHLLDQEELSIIVNTAEDIEVSGLHVSPDLDTVTYTLAGMVNEETWWGIRGDTFACHEMLKRLGWREPLRIGDIDRAINLRRTILLKQGKTLSEATGELCKQLGVRARAMPMSNERVRTRVHTEAGEMSFNEFWVVRRARDRVTNITFDGAEKAKAAPGVLDALEDSEAILIGPSNPVTSIGPILSIKEIRDALSRSSDRVFAVSPIIGNRPVSGPAGTLMQGTGYEVSPVGVARIYTDLVGTLIIDRSDEGLARKISAFGIKIFLTDLLMPDIASRVKLAREILSLVRFQRST